MTMFGTQMSMIAFNTGGALQKLPPVTLVGGRTRSFIENVALASQPVGTLIVIARLPVFAAFLQTDLITDTSLGSATVQVQDFNPAGPDAYSQAATLTTINASSAFTRASVYGVPTNRANVWDYLGNPRDWLDLCLVVGVAALPAAGNLTCRTNYVID